MLRHISAARNILSRSPKFYNVPSPQVAIYYQSARFKYKQPKERDTCPPPPPPPPPTPPDDRLFWGMMALAVCFGTFAYFAKNNKEVRDWLTIHAPWYDDFIAFLHEENQTYSDYIKCRFIALKIAVTDYFDTEKEPCVLDSEGNKIVVQGPKEEKEAECEKPPPPVVAQDICEVEKCLRDVADSVVNNYFTAKEICKYYNNLVKEYMTEFSMPRLKELRFAMEERIDLVNTSLENAAASNAKLVELTGYLDCGVKATKEQIASTKVLLEDYQMKIKTITMEYQWEYDQSIAHDEQWQNVEKLMDQYTKENKTIYPVLDYESEKPYIMGNADMVLHHTLRYIRYLREQLADAQCAISERVNRGVETALPQDEQNRKRVMSLIDSQTKKGRGDIDKDIKTKLDNQKKKNDARLKDELKKALDASQANLKKQLEKTEAEFTLILDKLVAEKVTAEKRLFKSQLDDMAAKLKRVEDKLHEHLKADTEARRCQELWCAGTALLKATRRGEPVVNVQRELKAVEKAAGDADPLVTSLLKAIPNSVREEGLVPASQLRKKYHSMESTALKVALVEEDGAPMPIYFLSLLQWALLCLRLSDIPKAEIEKPPDDVTHLDTFDLLLRARYWIDRGEVALALRYAEALAGASRAAADTWRRSARAHLETRLAAEALVAHAAARALRYIPSA